MHIQDVDITLIDIPAGRRVVDPDWAEALAVDIQAHGLKEQIHVIKAGERLRLIAGAHRLAAAKRLSLKVIGAKVYEPSEYASEAAIKLAEISENFKRRELTVLDRAFDVAAWREVYEEAAGAVKPGRKKNRVKFDPNSEDALEEQSALFASSFTTASQKALGLNKEAVKRYLRIARITQGVREQISLAPIADNQSQLLALSAEPAERQVKIANLLTSNPPACSTVEDAIAMIDHVPRASKPERWERVSDQFGKLPETAQRRFMIEHWSIIETILAEREAA
ncbi:MAG: ParB/RepB/Spo0J family partition protein [Martelella sp.]|uniref:ParB/RepB/Spo0J family partition protein n=1 Tax=Martelella sp. TaxID=1969699 RepID=UPI003242B027